MEYRNLTQILEQVNSNKLCVLVGSTKDCGVCVAIRPKIEGLVEKYCDTKGIYVYVDSLEEAAGKFMIFTVPTIIVFAEGKEVHRESRIIDFKRLEFELSRWNDYLAEYR